jgi:hypothetical protein
VVNRSAYFSLIAIDPAATILMDKGLESSNNDCAENLLMTKTSKKRRAASSIKIDPNVRCMRIYPVEDNAESTKTIADLKTVGIKLSKDQAIHLSRVLLAAAQEWDEIDVTAWRVYKRKSDGTYNITVTTDSATQNAAS